LKITGGDANTSTQKHAWVRLSEGERKALGDEAENDGILKAKEDKGKEVTGALNSITSIMKVLDDIYDTKSVFLYGTWDVTEEEYKLMTGIYFKGDEIKVL
jgi:hypothetical protein